jgi:hypothetical protein
MSSLKPELALAYVRELSADFRAGIVLDAAHQRLAGHRDLEAPARALLQAHPQTRELHATARDGRAQLFAARTADRAIVVVTGPHALPNVTRRDLRTVLGQNPAETVQQPPSEHPDRALVEALTTAVADAFRP